MPAHKLVRRRKRVLLTLAQRLQAARRKAAETENRRCPLCGRLCPTLNGNPGTRAACESCGA